MSIEKRTVTHRVTGEKITFLETAGETNGQYLYIEVSLPPQGMGPPLHIHNEFVEAFEIMQGQLQIQVGKEKHVLSVGEKLVAPIGTAHTFSNPHDEAVTFRVKLTPPSYFEQSVKIHYGLMDDGLADEKGNPRVLSHTALILNLQNTWIAGIPMWIQKPIFGWIIRKGYRKGDFSSLSKYVTNLDAIVSNIIKQ